MAYCGKCGTQLSEGANFCPKCGTPCSNASCQSVEANVVKQKKSSKVSSKVLLFAILVIAIIGGGWFAWKNLGNDYSLEGLANVLPNYDIEEAQSRMGYKLPSFYEGLAKVKKGEKYGFKDMKEWANMIRGTLMIDSKPGKGTKVCLLCRIS